MARTPSTMLPLGTPAPDLCLRDAVEGREVRLDDLRGGKGLLVMFLCNHCPFVIHVREVLTEVAHEALDRGVAAVAVNSNDVEHYPQDGLEPMRQLARDLGWRFPFLLDDTQDVARAYRAACTPDLYLFDAGLRLYYRGQLDGSRPGNDIPVTGAALRAALQSLLRGDPPPEEQRPSIGCNIKWKPGGEPGYFG